MTGDDAAGLLRTAAERLERLAARTTGGDWRLAGLLATRPEVVAHAADGGSEHVAEARGRTGEWIAALSPDLAAPLAAWLRAAADAGPVDDAAIDVARLLTQRLPGHQCRAPDDPTLAQEPHSPRGRRR